MSDTLKRIGLWTLGRMLPRRRVFAGHIRHLAHGVAWFVCGGVLLAAVFLAVLAGTYSALIVQGISAVIAAVIVGVVAILAGALCFLMAERSLDKAASITDELQMHAPSLPRIQADLDLQEGVTVLFRAFMDGLRGEDHERKKKATAMEEEETILSRVEVEREYDAEKDIIRFRPRARRTDEG